MSRRSQTKEDIEDYLDFAKEMGPRRLTKKKAYYTYSGQHGDGKTQVEKAVERAEALREVPVTLPKLKFMDD